MAASMNDIKARLKSVESTMQITKAMELVATSKLRRVKERAELARPYHAVLARAMATLEKASASARSVWSERREGGGRLYVVIAGDRGLAGGYNSNVFKLAEALSAGDEKALFLPIGKKAAEHFKRRGKRLFSDECFAVSDVGVGGALALGREIAEAYRSGAVAGVSVIYTRFISMLAQQPTCESLLPFEAVEGDAGDEPIIDGDPEELLCAIAPEYVGGMLWAALCEANAAEQGARRNSMSSANKNAEEMIDALMLRYNRARQAVITQEITEIVSGAETL